MLKFKPKCKSNIFYITSLITFSIISSSAFSQSLTDNIDELTQKVQQACPSQWEDIKSDMSNPSNSNLWLDDNDKQAYLEFKSFESNNTAALVDTDVIHADCTKQRLDLINALYGKLPQKVLVAMSSIDYQPGQNLDGFEVGDIRHTSRVAAAPGWLFLIGQSVGNANSGAILAGDEYKELFLLMSRWPQNNPAGITWTDTCSKEETDESGATKISLCQPGSDYIPPQERWENGEVLYLPNAQGRTIVGATALGQSHADASALPSSSGELGTTVGKEKHQLTAAEMPSHSHTMNKAGKHRHKHNYYILHYQPKGWRKLAPSGGEMRTSGGPTYTDYAGDHTHTINPTGGNQAHSIVQPSIFFNVEMKYSSRLSGLTNQNPSIILK